MRMRVVFVSVDVSAGMNRERVGQALVSRQLLRKVARQQFGWPSLRPGQFKPMRAVLRRRDALVVLPTGAGKSAIYQIPAVLLPGPTVVISPLLALQQDQITALNERNDGKIRAVRVSSAETPKSGRPISFASSA